jgi:hypothetical protein
VRPSSLLDGDIEAIQIDWFCLEAGLAMEEKTQREAERKMQMKQGRSLSHRVVKRG